MRSWTSWRSRRSSTNRGQAEVGAGRAGGVGAVEAVVGQARAAIGRAGVAARKTGAAIRGNRSSSRGKTGKGEYQRKGE